MIFVQSILHSILADVNNKILQEFSIFCTISALNVMFFCIHYIINCINNISNDINNIIDNINDIINDINNATGSS